MGLMRIQEPCLKVLWQDKAAAYAIQGKGALFIKEIKGDFFNILGLPLYRLREILMSLQTRP